MGFRTYDVDTLVEFMGERLGIGPLRHQLRYMIALDLGIPVKDVDVDQREDGEWEAMVKVPPREYIPITFDRPALDAE